MKKHACIFLILALVLCCLGPAAAAADEAAETPAEALPIEGEYVLYSIEYNGKQMKPSDMYITSSVTLNKDGTGVVVMNGGETAIAKWEEKDGALTLYNSSGAALECSVQDGIVTLQMGENYYFYYAHEGTGIAGEEAGRQTESMLYALRADIDAEAGAHLNYEYHSDYMDSTSAFDVHAKAGVYYSERVTRAAGYEQRSAAFYKDGDTYVLYPDKLQGSIATSVTTDIITKNVLMLDSLYQLIYTMSLRGDYTVETRELEGEEYTVEVFPATEYKAEAAFYFNEEGELLHVLTGAPKLSPELGETFYTIHAIDTEADETLFDISAYKITK